jgi:hypothetical protein
MNARQQPSIEDFIATESGGKDLDKATVEEVISVYTNVFVTIEERLQTDLEYFPPQTVTSIKRALNTILLKFESFIKQSLEPNTKNDIKLVIPYLQLAIASIISASKTLDPTPPDPQVYLDATDQQVYMDATEKFTLALMKCRYQIGWINSHLEHYLTDK